MSNNTMYRFLIIIEKGKRNYSAYAPDLPGCVARGKTLEEVKENMQGAIAMHLEGMIEDKALSLQLPPKDGEPTVRTLLFPHYIRYTS